VQATYRGDELDRVERITHNRSGLWIAIGISVLGLLVFTGIFNFLLPNLGANLGEFALILLGLIFSLVPAALWLVFFYQFDRLEPEPKQMVFNVFVLGALIAGALHAPLVNGLFGFRDWQYNSWWAHLLGGILIVGVIEQALVYLAVRFSVFDHPDFDERVDGVIYAIAAGLGMATIYNFQYVVGSRGVDLDIGSIRMVVNALAYASFSGVLGYFIGQMRFEKVPIYYMPVGLLSAAAFNGLFFFLLDRTFSGGLNYNPWSDLIFAAAIAVISLALVFWLIERANEETLRLTRQPLTSGPGFGAIETPGLAPAPAETVLPAGAEYSTPPSMAEPSVAEPSGVAGDEPPAAPSDTAAHTSPSAPEENA
jgi:RsiW-degrading membrane proteinase PrsW (M82 family)